MKRSTLRNALLQCWKRPSLDALSVRWGTTSCTVTISTVFVSRDVTRVECRHFLSLSQAALQQNSLRVCGVGCPPAGTEKWELGEAGHGGNEDAGGKWLLFSHRWHCMRCRAHVLQVVSGPAPVRPYIGRKISPGSAREADRGGWVSLPHLTLSLSFLTQPGSHTTFSPNICC
jgi:hypothetical protein